MYIYIYIRVYIYIYIRMYMYIEREIERKTEMDEHRSKSMTLIENNQTNIKNTFFFSIRAKHLKTNPWGIFTSPVDW